MVGGGQGKVDWNGAKKGYVGKINPVQTLTTAYIVCLNTGDKEDILNKRNCLDGKVYKWF